MEKKLIALPLGEDDALVVFDDGYPQEIWVKTELGYVDIAKWFSEAECDRLVIQAVERGFLPKPY